MSTELKASHSTSWGRTFLEVHFILNGFNIGVVLSTPEDVVPFKKNSLCKFICKCKISCTKTGNTKLFSWIKDSSSMQNSNNKSRKEEEFQVRLLLRLNTINRLFIYCLTLWVLGPRRLPPGAVTTLTNLRLYWILFLARPRAVFFFSWASTLGVWFFTLPARARDPWTLPPPLRRRTKWRVDSFWML